ncbi:hypothetical protein [Sphingorhabdus sp.]|uniref:hypothetical protein n=1 Tax=Sphingorhabdus sp. TaxID=1902408 RepID=UPI0033415395
MAAFPLPAARTYKPTVEDCITLDTFMLRQNGMLLEFMDHRLQRRWQLGSNLVGDIFLTTTFTGDIVYPSLQIDGTCFGQPVMQTVQLVSRRMRFGGNRWYFVCPHTKRLCCKLILPPGAKAFASVKGWGLSYRSQYDDAVMRAQKAIGKLTARSIALPKYTRTGTREAFQARITAKNAFLDRVEERYAEDLLRGRRVSLRRAVKFAQMVNG